MMDVYDSQSNIFLKSAKNLVPRIITYSGIERHNVAFGLVENKKSIDYYYCFFTRFGFVSRDRVHKGDAISKLSLTDYFEISQSLLGIKLKFNLKKIIYDSNRNK